MRLPLIVLTGFLFSVCSFALAKAPVAVETIAPLEDLVLESDQQLERLEKLLETEESFTKAKDGDVRQGFGLLACLGQAIAEHTSHADTEIQGPALRDAALKFSKKSTYDEAKATLEEVKVAHSGKATGEHAVEHPWNKLINMHPMMEEMNSRNSALLKVIKRPRGKADEPMHATTWAILALAMHADTHEVKNEADIPKYHEFSDSFRTAAIHLAEAIRKKDKAEAQKWFDTANESCDACHEVFKH